jgi:hypothetical protein
MGARLRIRFLDAEADLHDHVISIANEWLKEVSLNLEVADTDDAEIRVTFQTDYLWSYVGTDALFVTPKTKPTMCLGAISSEGELSTIRSVVLHQFGHAFGLIHKPRYVSGTSQQGGGISLNRDAFRTYFDAVVTHEHLQSPLQRSDVFDQVVGLYYREMDWDLVCDPRAIMTGDVARRYNANVHDDNELVSVHTLASGISERESKMIRDLYSRADGNPYGLLMTGPGPPHFLPDDLAEVQPDKSGPNRTPTATENATHLLPDDPDLAAVVDAWPHLPEAIRAAIVAMVNAASKGVE